MKTLYRKFIFATLAILLISLIAGYLCANIIYNYNTKNKIDQHNVNIATEIVQNLNNMHDSPASFTKYLESIGNLGYQMYVVNTLGEEYYFGQPFKKNELPQEAMDVLTNQSIYHGMNSFTNKYLMMGHFSNDIRNTVGVPFKLGEEQYGLFIRPNNELLFSDMHRILVWFIAAVGVISLAGVVWFAKHLIRPITKLTKATHEITRENFTYALEIERNDEIGQLAKSFNLMQRHLQHNDEARKAFINNVSHDFQSPLMNIQGYAELLRSNSLSDTERNEYLQIIDDESKRLSNLTKQLLLLTSLDQKGYPMKYSFVQIDEQIKQAIRRHQWRLEEKEIEVSYKLPAIKLKADAELLNNVWENILTNAIKYNAHGGRIWIGMTDSEQEVVITFKDTGIGLTEEAASKVFDRFYRVDTARKKDGTGLGLSIVQQIVKLHGGHIALESQPGMGSTFSIMLPYKK